MPFHRCLLRCFVLMTASSLTAVTPVTVETQVEVKRALAPESETPLPALAAVPMKIVLNRCDVKSPVIALTFDDGPHPDFTPRLLDTLKQQGIKATFFMVGRCVVTWPQIVKRIADEGHEVANHSWSHPLLTSLGTQGLESQLRRTHDAIVKACGIAPLLYRPPYGEIRLSQRKRVNEVFDYTAILWDVDPLDWQSPRTVQKVHDRVLAQTKAGSIILCHDIHETTVDAMPALIAELKTRGFQFATVSQLMELEARSALPLAAPASTSPAAPPAQNAPAPKLSDPLPLTLPGEATKQPAQ